MNGLITTGQTMSSREIAELCSKEHKNVTVVIESLIQAHILTAEIQRLNYEHRGNTYKYYALNSTPDILGRIFKLCR